MNPQQLQQVQVAAPLIAVGLFILALLLMLLSVYYFRRSRTDFYWRSRRRAGQFGWRIFVVALSLTLVSGIICVVIGVGGMLTGRLGRVPTALLSTSTAIAQNATPTKAPTEATAVSTTEIPTENAAQPTLDATLTDTSTELATESVVPTETNTPIRRTATRKPTITQAATATPSITPTPSDTFVPAAPAMLLTIESSVTPPADAKLDITALDIQISPDFKPVSAAKTFNAGFKRIYYFVTFKQMLPGILWRRQLLYNGDVLDDIDYTWGLEQDGTAYFFFGRDEGFPSGQYEIRLYIGQNSSPITTASFNAN
jgi:hypothetical protein